MDLSGTLTTKKIVEKRPPSSRANKARPATTSFSKRSHQIQSEGASHHQIGRVPPLPLFDKGGSSPSLELHSSPVHLATRSLSARAVHSSSAVRSSSTVSLPSSLKQSSLGAPVTASKSERSSGKRHSARNSGKSKVGGKPKQANSHSSRTSHSNGSQDARDVASTLAKDDTPTPGHGGSMGETRNGGHIASTASTAGDGGVSVSRSGDGFNIAEHLLKNADIMERTDGSLSPEINQFLQDISSVVQTLSPDHSQLVEGREHTSEGKTELKSQSSPRHKSRPKIAANFGTLNTKSEEGGQTVVNSNSHLPIPDSTTAMTLDPNVAASRIQQWYRENKSSKQTAQVHSLLASKRDELNRSRSEELQRIALELEARELKERGREKRRAAKMQAARRAAIEDLKRKREEKRERAEKIAQEEIALLQASGKIKWPKSSHKKPSSSKKKEDKPKDSDRPLATKAIDEFFEAGDSRQHKIPSASAAPHTTTDSPTPPPQGSTHSPPPDSTHHPPHNSSTYNNILKTLALLEEAPPPLAEPTKPMSNDNTNFHLNQSGYYLSVDNVNKLESLSANGGVDPALITGMGVASSGGLSESKLQSILSYLDEMDKADQDLLSEISKTRSRPKTEALPTPRTAAVTMKANRGAEKSKKSGNENFKDTGLSSELDVATAVASDVTSTIMTQRLELDNKSKTVDMLQKALSQQRELTVYHAKEMEKEGQRRLDLQKQEYETTIQRHQCFIDQLIDDKKVLSERCEQLVQELKELDKKYKTRLKMLEDNHTAELAKIKQVSAAADKLRREKWRVEETQRIKEATVRSLEPEIQRIIAKGKAEIQKLKAIHEAELLQSDERASRRFVAQMEELRAQCAEEKEQACAHERELARQRYEKLAEQEELSYQQQRRKLFGEVQQEKEKLAAQFHQQKVLLEQQQRQMEEDKLRYSEDLKVSHSQQLEEMQRRHSIELREQRERLELERQAWEENLLKRQETSMMTREREMKEQLRQERDKEIEMVIGRLEEETASSREECERAAEARVKRIRDKYEAELREVERSERQTLEKFNTMKSQVVEMEGEVTRLNSLLRQKEREVDQVSQVATKLTSERDNVADVVRQEFADRLVSTDEENKQLKMEMSELRARHKVELERVRKGKEREMGEVHERVKQALAKKEDNLTSLRQQYEAALKRADHLEMLLERQRKELLKK